MKRVALQNDVDKQKILADEATTEASMLEQVFDRIAQLYRQVHTDHQSLIKQWEHSVQAMHLKDKDIHNTLNVRTCFQHKLLSSSSENKRFYKISFLTGNSCCPCSRKNKNG